MGDLTYLIIFLVVVNLAGRIFRAIQKGAGQQAPGAKQGSRPTAQPRAKPKDPFAVLAERLEELGRLEKESPALEEPPPYSTAEAGTDEFEAKAIPVAAPENFAHETAATLESDFERMPRKELHERSFPWQDTQYEYRTPTKPVTRASGPEPEYAPSYRGDIMEMLKEPEGLRNAVLLGMILGPCRAREGRRRFRGPR